MGSWESEVNGMDFLGGFWLVERVGIRQFSGVRAFLMKILLLICVLWGISPLSARPADPGEFEPVLESCARPWIGPEIWANPMEDWELDNGKARNTHSGGDRELVPLTVEVVEAAGDFEIAATFEPEGKPLASGFIGFQLGLRGEFNDYRDSAIYGAGFCVGLRGDGHLFIAGTHSKKPLTRAFDGPVAMKLNGAPNPDGSYRLVLTANGEELVHTRVHSSWLAGMISFTVSASPPNEAVVMNQRPARVVPIVQARRGDWRFAVLGLRASGSKIRHFPDRSFGPIFWTQHTLESSGRLNLTAQLAPVALPAKAELFLDGRRVAEESVDACSRVAAFRVEALETGKDHGYEVRYGSAVFAGRIRREPVDKERLVVASLSCNDATGFPHSLMVGNVMAHRPDVVAFLGDQIYEGIGGYGLVLGADNTGYDDRTTLSYLRKYSMHGWTWRELLRDTPSLTIPDDHDVYHGNIWGAGGKLADRSSRDGADIQDSGGYKMSVGFVNAVHQTQTGNLPPPVDPEPCGAGISVWFTSWKYAGIDMAILSDRQFKSAPKALLPESDIRNGWPRNHTKQKPALVNPRELDVPGAELLGARQEAFLARWAEEKDAVGTRWRLVFSATPLVTVQTIPSGEFSDSVVPSLERPRPGEYPEDDIPKLDYDSNGWPQTKRDSAVGWITRAGAVHVTGDQHLGSTGQYGREKFNDSAWWISSPATANIWPRRWFPQEPGGHRRAGEPAFTGEFEDGFGNRMTLHAVANPFDIDREPSRLYDKAVGYSISILDRATGHVQLANWPYQAGPSQLAPDNVPYPGWPVTIDPVTNRRVD